MNAETVEVMAQQLPSRLHLSPHFTVQEIACRHCGRVFVVPTLLEMLERLREAVGTPLVVNSGYRCPEHNRRIGGAPRSKHCLGMAADINIPKQHRIKTIFFLEEVTKIVLSVRGGFHYYPAAEFVHIDCWPWPPDRRW